MTIASMINSSGHLINHERPTETVTDYGSTERTWGVVGLMIKVWVQPASRFEIERYANLSLKVTHRVYVGEDMHVRIGDRLEFEGRKLLVHGVANVAERNELYLVDAEETVADD